MTAALIDVRTVSPRERHPLVFSRFDALAPGETLELVNDHDPRPLFFQFDSRVPGQFDWRYLEQGPATWRVAITRTAADRHEPGTESCCGGCGGA